MKIAQLIFLIPFLFFSSCRKDDKIYEHVNKIPGEYKGECSYSFIEIEGGGWSLYKPTITPYNDHAVKINYWPAGLYDIPLEVNKRDLTIQDHVDTVYSYNMGGAFLSTNVYRLNADGEYNENNHTIYMDFELEKKQGNPSVFTPFEKGYISVSRTN